MSLAGPDSAMQFLKTTVDPRNFTTAPPNMFNQSTFPKNVSINGNWVIRADTAVAGPVKDTKSIVIWNTQRGAATMQRLGFVPSATTVVPTSFQFQNLSASAWSAPTLTFAEEFCVPYDPQGSYQVQVAPDLSLDFSVVRTYAGMISLQSDSVPIGNTALTGRFAGGSINDIRDIQQSPNGAFTEANLQQQTITAKDGIKNVQAADGIVATLGPDLNPLFTAPYAWTTKNGGVSDVEVITTAYPGAAMAVALAGAVDVVSLWQHFYTPVSGLTLLDGGSPNPVINIAMNPIPNGGRCRLSVCVPDIEWSGGVDYFGAPDLLFSIYHLFGTVDDNGAITIHSATEHLQNSVNPLRFSPDKVVRITGTGAVTGTYSLTPGLVDLGDIPNMDIHQSIYLGSYVQCAASYQYIPSPTTPGIPATASFNASAGEIKMYVEALDIYNSGLLGPVRVLRWDNMSAGQEVKMDGVLIAQCVPEGQIAPFVTPTAQLQHLAMHLNVYPWLNAVYNGTGPFKRIWKGSDYADVVAKLREHGLDDLMKLPDEDIRKGEAAGLFGDLGHAIGSQLGSLAGQGLGSLVDAGVNAIPSLFAAGQFGGGNQSREYGQAMGQFGSPSLMSGMAAGQFGGQYSSNKRLRSL